MEITQKQANTTKSENNETTLVSTPASELYMKPWFLCGLRRFLRSCVSCKVVVVSVRCGVFNKSPVVSVCYRYAGPCLCFHGAFVVHSWCFDGAFMVHSWCNTFYYFLLFCCCCCFCCCAGAGALLLLLQLLLVRCCGCCCCAGAAAALLLCAFCAHSLWFQRFPVVCEFVHMFGFHSFAHVLVCSVSFFICLYLSLCFTRLWVPIITMETKAQWIRAWIHIHVFGFCLWSNICFNHCRTQWHSLEIRLGGPSLAQISQTALSWRVTLKSAGMTTN